MKNCPGCNVAPNKLHKKGCDIERCSLCGGQLISCDCTEAEKYEEEVEKYGGRLPWSGEYPGQDDCRKFNLWAYLAPGAGWTKCNSSYPGAIEDLNSLYSGFMWDKEKRCFVQRV